MEQISNLNVEIDLLQRQLSQVTELKLMLSEANRLNKQVYFPFSGVYFQMTDEARSSYEELKSLHQNDLQNQIDQKRTNLIQILSNHQS